MGMSNPFDFFDETFAFGRLWVDCKQADSLLDGQDVFCVLVGAATVLEGWDRDAKFSVLSEADEGAFQKIGVIKCYGGEGYREDILDFASIERIRIV